MQYVCIISFRYEEKSIIFFPNALYLKQFVGKTNVSVEGGLGRSLHFEIWQFAIKFLA